VNAFGHSAYWTRAWITQELILARRVTIMADNIELSAKDLPPSVAVVNASKQRGAVQLVSVWPQCFLRDSRGLDFVKGQSLPYLLSISKHQGCAVPRDRAFCLLSLCSEGSNILVDYKVRSKELAIRIIVECKHSFCLCSMMATLDALEVHASKSRIVQMALWFLFQPYFGRVLKLLDHRPLRLSTWG
jgi:hypothetical protein